MQDIIESIQTDILNPAVPLNTILLKAKVLAHQLKNERFKEWVKHELNGYPNDTSDIPSYRIIKTQLLAHIIGSSFFATDIPIGLSNTPKWFQDVAQTIKFTNGISAAEAIAQGQQIVYFPWPVEWIGVWSRANASQLSFQQVIGVKQPVAPQVFVEMVQSVRSRLQDFVLELSDVPWSMKERPLPSEQIEKLVDVTIYNNQGETVSTFDQRGQQVQNQNNAARDVHISGGISINSNADLMQAIRELRNLLDQVEQGNQQEIIAAIEVLENATQDNPVSKSEIVHAVETLSHVPTMREHLQNLSVGAGGSLAASAIIEGIKYVLGIGP